MGLLLSEAFHLEEPVGGSIKHRIHGLDLIPCDIDLLGETAIARKIGESFKHAHTSAGGEATSIRTAEMGGVIFVRVRLGVCIR